MNQTAYVQILSLPLTSGLTLDKLLVPWRLSFLVYIMGIIIVSNSQFVASVKLVHIYKVPRTILVTSELLVIDIITDIYMCNEENESKKGLSGVNGESWFRRQSAVFEGPPDLLVLQPWASSHHPSDCFRV